MTVVKAEVLNAIIGVQPNRVTVTHFVGVIFSPFELRVCEIT